ncbi:MAG: lipid-A-disaccharide synthase [Pirellulaceae bacterium]
MRIFFSVGEPSGDLHGANLIKDLRERHPELDAVGFGGPKMSAAGCQLLYELTSLAVMGLVSVLANVRAFFRLLAEADRYFAENTVDAVVLIDYPGFNWWIARKARKHNIRVFYYGVPQMWAWAPWRVRKLRRLVDHVICKLPFEETWFRQRGCPAFYVGHPYFDELRRYQMDAGFIADQQNDDGRLLVLLPGSRDQEVRRNLATLLNAASQVKSRHPATSVAVACYRDKHADQVRMECEQLGMDAKVFTGRTPELISLADACIACSGSVSLELLYHRTPTVIVYRLGLVTKLAQFVLLRVRYITLVNLLASDSIERGASSYDPDDPDSNAPMPEYPTYSDCSDQVATWINRWFDQPALLQQRLAQLDQLAKAFAQPGASERAAEYVFQQLQPEDPAQPSDRQMLRAA